MKKKVNMMSNIKHCKFKLDTCFLISYQLQYSLFPVGIDDVGFDVTGGDGGAYMGFSV